jgi:hypothetical protein
MNRMVIVAGPGCREMAGNHEFINLNTQPGSTGRIGRDWKIAGVKLAVVAVIIAAQSLWGAPAYLPAVGPTPLRFEAQTPRGMTLAWKAQFPLTPPAKPADAPSTNSIATATPATNAVVMSTSSPAPDTTGANSMLTPQTPVMVPYQSDESGAAITPQALAGYFKPTPGWHRSGGGDDGNTGEGRQPPVGFMPPSPKPPESRATYRTP